MSRSKWKGPYTNLEVKETKQRITNIVTRNSEIIPKFLNLTFKVHNGKNYSEIKVVEDMINHKFGEFAFTRARFSFKKKKKK
jgi:small subunit ribosomal protein S19